MRNQLKHLHRPLCLHDAVSKGTSPNTTSAPIASNTASTVTRHCWAKLALVMPRVVLASVVRAPRARAVDIARAGDVSVLSSRGCVTSELYVG